MEFNEKAVDVINDLIKINNDRAAGFKKAASDIEGDANGIVAVFNKLAVESEQYVTELTNLAQQHDGEIAEGTSTSGDLHRAWIDIKSAFTGSDLLAILNECERGEDAAKSAYNDALDPDNGFDNELMLLLQSQQVGINEGHDLIRALRDQFDAEADDYQSYEADDDELVTSEETEDEEYTAEPGTVEQDEELQDGGGNSRLMEFFIDELKDLMWAERELVDTLPEMAEAATSAELKEAFEQHLSETETHVTRLEEVFVLLGLEAETRKCEAMAGIIDEGDEIISATEEGTAQRDVGLIFAGQKAEHYEIASYGGMISLANTLGYFDVAKTLALTLDEEKSADAKLTEIAESQANNAARFERAD